MQNETGNSGSLKDKFEGFGSNPSSDVWAGVNAQLKQKRKRRFVFWIWICGLALLIGGIASWAIIVPFYSKDLSTENENALMVPFEITEPLEQQENLILNEQDIQTLSVIEEEQNSQQEFQAMSEPTTTIEKIDLYMIEENGKERVKVQTNPLKVESVPEQSKTIVKTDPILKIQKDKIALLPNEFGVFKLPPITIKTDPKPTYKWELKLYAGSYGPTARLDIDSTNYNSNLDQFENVSSDFLQAFSPSQNNISAFETGRPIFIGMGVSKRINERWTFNSGLEISGFTNRVYYNSGSVVSKKTNFVTMSIPIIIQFEWLQKERWKIYSGLGINNELPFLQISSNEYNATNASDYNQNNFNLKVGYIGSALLNTGVQFQLNNRNAIDFQINTRRNLVYFINNSAPIWQKRWWTGGSIGYVWKF